MIIDKIVRDVQEDSYFNDLYKKLCMMFARKTLKVKTEILSKKELKDILRFADILSNSNSEIARNQAYRIVGILKSVYKDDEIYIAYTNAVLKKLANFPALKGSPSIKLPVDRELEYELNKKVLKAPMAEMYFTPTQHQIYEKMNNTSFFSFVGPTSMGKSFIIKQFILSSISRNENKNFCIIVPTRALIKQYVLDLHKDLSKVENKMYNILTNSNILDYIDYENGNFIFVLTPERLLSLTSRSEYIKINYLIIDEAHKMFSDNTRGLTYFTSIDMCLSKYENLKVFFSTPLINNPEIFKDIYYRITSQIYSTAESPVTHNLFFIDLLDKKVEFIDSYKFEFNLQNIEYMNNKNDLIYELGKRDNNIVYVRGRDQSVKSAEEFSQYLKQRNIFLLDEEENQEITKVCQIIIRNIHKDYYLIDCLQQGVAFHHSKLPTIIRERIEDLFRKGIVKYLFCTNTLLEGVNLPAKNIFVSSNYIGNRKISSIDFWNLAGRAGRLGYEYYGNIFCIRDNDRVWKDKKVLEDKGNIRVNNVFEDNMKKHKAEIKEIISVNEVKIAIKKDDEYTNYLANIIQIDSMNNKKSSMIKQSEVVDTRILDICKSIKNNVKLDVLNVSKSIDIKVQNNVLNNLFLKKLPNNITKDTCYEILVKMHTYYKWDIKEARLKNINSMKYFAVLMNQWINDTPLNLIIAYSIEYNATNNCSIMVDYGKFERFNKNNKSHINILINNIITNIEDVLRYDFEKYFSHYYLLLESIFGEGNVGPNWSTFLEFGTRSKKNILLQNLGFSRYSAHLLLEEYADFLNFKEESRVSINKDIFKSNAKENGILLNELIKIIS